MQLACQAVARCSKATNCAPRAFVQRAASPALATMVSVCACPWLLVLQLLKNHDVSNTRVPLCLSYFGYATGNRDALFGVCRRTSVSARKLHRPESAPLRRQRARILVSALLCIQGDTSVATLHVHRGVTASRPHTLDQIRSQARISFSIS